MVARPKPQAIRIRAGDSLSIPMVVRDKKTEDAQILYQEYTLAYKRWRDFVNTDPQNQENITQALGIARAAFKDFQDMTVIDITGWSVILAISWGGKIYNTITCAIPEPLSGLFTLSVTDAISSALRPREYTMCIHFVLPDGKEVSSVDMILSVDQNLHP